MRLAPVIVIALVAGACRRGEEARQPAAAAADSAAQSDASSDGGDARVDEPAPRLSLPRRPEAPLQRLERTTPRRLPRPLRFHLRRVGGHASTGQGMLVLGLDEGQTSWFAALGRGGQVVTSRRAPLGRPVAATSCGGDLVVLSVRPPDCPGGQGCPGDPALLLSRLDPGGAERWSHRLEELHAIYGVGCDDGDVLVHWAPDQPAELRWAAVDAEGVHPRGRLTVPAHRGLEALRLDDGWLVALVRDDTAALELRRFQGERLIEAAVVAPLAVEVALAEVEGRFVVLHSATRVARMGWYDPQLRPLGDSLVVTTLPAGEAGSSPTFRHLDLLESDTGALAVVWSDQRVVGHRYLTRPRGCVPMLQFRCGVRLWDWRAGALGPAVEHDGPCGGAWAGDELLLVGDEDVARLLLVGGGGAEDGHAEDEGDQDVAEDHQDRQ